MSEAALDLAFAALADPLRRAIVTRLMNGPATVKELAEPFPVSAPAITRHLDVLERAGLINRGRQAQFRPCSLAPGGIDALRTWINRTAEHWEGSFDKLAAALAAEDLGAEEGKAPDDRTK
jgi:DNA-binding transcriptional ArsR family regulator